jgi:hypothetical protein
MLITVDTSHVVRLKGDVRIGALAAAVMAVIVLLPMPYVAVPMFYATYRMNRGALWAGTVNLVLTGVVSLLFGYVWVSERENIVTGGSGETTLYLTLIVGLALVPAVLVGRALKSMLDLQRHFESRGLWPKGRSNRSRWRWRAAGWITAGLLVAVVLTVLVIFSYAKGFELLDGPAEGVLALSLLPALYWIVKKYRNIQLWTRRRMADSVAEVRKGDRRPPVLLLRSFRDDEVNLTPLPRFDLWTVLDAHETKAGYDFTLEEAVAEGLWEHGPVVALNEPGRTLPPLGAARESIPGERWQEVIDRYICEATRIVAVAASSPGLLWEIERILQKDAASKLLLVFPPIQDIELAARWKKIYPLFNRFASAEELRDAPISKTLVARFGSDPSVVKLYTGTERTQNSFDTAIRMALADAR